MSPDLLCATDHEGVFVAVNPAWEQMLGWTAADLLGRPFGDFLSEEDRDRTRAVWEQRVLAGEPVVDFQNRWPSRDGGARWISWAARLGPNRDLVYCSGRDITDRVERFVQVAHEADLLAEAERTAGIGVWEWYVEHDVAYLSPGLARILGTPVGEPHSFAQLLEMIVPADRDRVERLTRRAAEYGLSFEAEYRLRRPDGREITVWEHGDADVEAGGAMRRMYGTIKDITQQREIEAELEQAAATQRAAADQLRELDRLKTTILSAVSHELRTPLTVVQGMAETLRRLRGDLSSTARDRIEDALTDHAERLGALLDDLLDVDRLARGVVQLGIRRVDVAALVRSVVAASPVADRAEVHGPQQLEVDLDPVQTERIVANLLGNAAKYAPHGPVTVGVEPMATGGVRLEVTDEGPGVDASSLARIFEPFYRTDDRHPAPGTGVGLALVAEFVRLHGGRVWAEPHQPTGLCFVVELPDRAPTDEVVGGDVDDR